MPLLPPLPCRHPRCPHLLPPGVVCPDHPSLPPPGGRGLVYDRAWTTNARAFLTSFPYCEGCGAVATQVHHVQGREDGGPDTWDNLQGLCGSCHARLTQVDSRAGRGL
jgi:5-methylcytosine-specific restriction protein A